MIQHPVGGNCCTTVDHLVIGIDQWGIRCAWAPCAYGISTKKLEVTSMGPMSGSFLRGSVAVVIRTTPVYKNISYIYKTYIQVRWIGETKMNVMDECSLYTINFATARPIAFTSLHRHVHTIPRSVRPSYCYHLVASSLFFTVPTRHAAAGQRVEKNKNSGILINRLSHKIRAFC